MGGPLPPGNPPAGLWLGIETSQRVASVALAVCGEDNVLRNVAEATIDPAAGAALESSLVSTIAALLAQCGKDREEIAGVVVGTGPGGFTGTRIGVATGQGIAESLGVPIAGVPSAVGVAAGVGAGVGPGAAAAPNRSVLVALAAKAESCWLTEVEPGALRVSGAREASVMDEGLAAALARAWILVGDEHSPKWLRAAAAERGLAHGAPEFRAGRLLEAAALAGAGGCDGGAGSWWTSDPAHVVPLYARQAAVTLRPVHAR